MLSYLEMDQGAVIPLHDHPHEQGGMLIEGRLEFTLGEETRIVEAGAMFLIPPNVPHRVHALEACRNLHSCSQGSEPRRRGLER